MGKIGQLLTIILMLGAVMKFGMTTRQNNKPYVVNGWYAMQGNDLTNLNGKVTAVDDGVETLSEGIQNLTASEGIVEGIIAGTSGGVVIITLDILEQRPSLGNYTRGVAFNWESRKVYWIESDVGIMTADLDGSSMKLLVPDKSQLCGLAIDQVTGNFYFGVQGSNPEIKVCDSMGKKCATVLSGVNNVGSSIRDIALSPSEGLMFWSSVDDKKSVIRANMDGTDSTIIILENIYGLFVHEIEEKLYWANFYRKSIGHRDLYGLSRKVLFETEDSPYDIAVDGDTLYFGGHSPDGVFSVTGNGTVTKIATPGGQVIHLALYGRNKVSSRQNPCKNSPCMNLCVLTRGSYSCF